MRFFIALLTIGFVFAIIVLVIKIAYKYLSNPFVRCHRRSDCGVFCVGAVALSKRLLLGCS